MTKINCCNLERVQDQNSNYGGNATDYRTYLSDLFTAIGNFHSQQRLQYPCGSKYRPVFLFLATSCITCSMVLFLSGIDDDGDNSDNETTMRHHSLI
ncbi:tRNA(Ile)-lysidine synthase [Dirofilaria immitis]